MPPADLDSQSQPRAPALAPPFPALLWLCWAQVFELSEEACSFLATQFALYDEDRDGLLTHQQLEAMNSTVPPPVWKVSMGALGVESALEGPLGLRGMGLDWRVCVKRDHALKVRTEQGAVLGVDRVPAPHCL